MAVWEPAASAAFGPEVAFAGLGLRGSEEAVAAGVGAEVELAAAGLGFGLGSLLGFGLAALFAALGDLIAALSSPFGVGLLSAPVTKVFNGTIFFSTDSFLAPRPSSPTELVAVTVRIFFEACFSIALVVVAF